MKLLIGILLGGTLAMMFPDQARQGYALVRDSINSAANYVAETTQPTAEEKISEILQNGVDRLRD